jgi:hypothetical protein
MYSYILPEGKDKSNEKFDPYGKLSLSAFFLRVSLGDAQKAKENL